MGCWEGWSFSKTEPARRQTFRRRTAMRKHWILFVVIAGLYSSKSHPLDPPDTGEIAVTVINHHGEQVLKVYEI